MRRKHQEEIAELAATYSASRQQLLPGVADLLAEVSNYPTIFVGSGGALALAQFAASVHQRFTGRFAMGLTPLEFSSALFSDPTALVLLSSGGKNADARLALESGLEGGCWPVGLITRRSREELDDSLPGAV